MIPSSDRNPQYPELSIGTDKAHEDKFGKTALTLDGSRILQEKIIMLGGK